MEARNCPRCKKIFNYVRSPVCPACEKEEEETFVALRNFIDENPGCRMAELSETTGVSIKRITQYIRDGRLEISKGMSGEIKCDNCGKPIMRGRYCDVCAVKMHQNLNDMFKKEEKKKPAEHSTVRMHSNGDD
jgi:flagellar operon protein (TIGR03826 family)